MAFTEVTNESWFGRIGGAFKGIVVGGLLFLVAFPVQFWNEGRAVRRIKTLAEGKGAVVADVTTETILPENEGKLVHMIGLATATGTIADSKFGISVDDALKLQRNVEMYQWHEDVKTKSKKKLGGGKRKEKTYSYYKDWSSSYIDSNDFHDNSRSEIDSGNPNMPFQSKTEIADKVLVGAFRLSESLTNMIDSFESLDVSGQIENLPDDFKDRALAHSGGFYLGEDPGKPKIGDIRVSYAVVQPTTISFVSQQQGESFRPYSAKSVSGTIERLEIGEHSVDEMFEHMENENTMLTWLIRVGGLALMVVGIGLALSPLVVLADVVPIMGGVVGVGTWLIAFLVGCVFSLMTISIAWVFYRPVFGICLLAVAVAIGVFAYTRTSKASQVNFKTEDGIPVIG